MLDTLKNTEENESSPNFVVGIGASAGGLEALEEFFGNLPADTGAAFVVVQHLSPDFKSMMPELLSKHTDMPIYQVNDGFKLEKNSIYLMPARTNMLIKEKTLRLSNQNPYRHLNMPIDIFFNSLAHDQQHHAIGIILSGTGSDGTRGVKTIKELGGLIIVQNPESAKFDGMPNSANKTALVDFVMDAREMGECLQKFMSHSQGNSGAFDVKPELNVKENNLERIFTLLKNHSAINFSQYKASTVARRIERRLAITESNNLDEYLRFLLDSPKEVNILCRELLINVTRFFRDTDAFDYLARHAIPEIVKRANDNNEDVRVWIAACSTGEEAYSIAILIDEEIKKKGFTCKAKIFATDVDDDAVATASAGVFSKEIATDVSALRLEKYFSTRENSYEISQHIRQMVIFASHNMIDDAPFSNLHLVSCRNVLIYFQHAAQKKVLSSLYFSLQRDGYLFLGSSESLGDIKTQYETQHEKFKIYQKTTNLRIPLGSSPPTRDLAQSMASRYNAQSMMPTGSIMRSERTSGKNPLAPVMERLVKDFAPDSIVLNDSHDAIHVFGDVSLFTQGVKPGRISNSIRDIIIEDLSVAVSTALYRCEKNEADVFYKDVVVKTGDETQISIDLSILYLRENDLPSTPHLFLVQFIQQGDEVNISHKQVSFDANEQSRQRIQDLEQELVKKQEHLQVTIEELETTNEELQSTNEELMSANEEMQSTNEELQSVNEELYTVNSEYQEKIVLLTEANNDLDNVINATDIGIIFLDDALCIRKFTSAASKFVNLLDSDVGRPFHHISHKLQYDNLIGDVSQVGKEGKVIEKEIISEKKQKLFIRICDYSRSQNSEVPGVIITITDISRLRFIESALGKAQDEIRRNYLAENTPIAKRITKEKDLVVLVLDDDDVDRVQIERVLSAIPKRNFQIHSTATIKEAVNTAKKLDTIDLCLTDYQLAEGTAKDFHQELEENNIDIPLIVLSGFSEEGLDAEFLQGEIYDFLNKDELSSQLLERSIDFVLEKNKLREAITPSH